MNRVAAKVAPDFILDVPVQIRGQISRFKANIQKAIAAHLGDIARMADAPVRARARHAAQGPPPRFYVFDGYRVTYRVDQTARTVVVLGVECVPA